MEAASVLLEILGSNEEARDALRETAEDLAAFDRETAEAELDVNATKAKNEIKAIRSELARLDSESAAPEVKALIADAMVNLRRLEREVQAVDRMDATVDIDVRRGSLETAIGGIGQLKARVAEAVPEFGRLTVATERSERRMTTFGGGMRSFAGGIRTVGTILIGLLIPGMISLAGTFVPLIAAAASGAAGLGALGVALAGAAVSAGVFGIAVARALKDGGPLAQELKQAVRGLGREFQDAAHVGVSAFLNGLIPAVQAVGRAMPALKQAFTTFGNAAGQAVFLLGDRLAGLVPEFGKLTGQAAFLAGPVARGIGNLAEIFLNIARAAMPSLVRGATSFADLLGVIARKTRDIGATRSVIATMVTDFKALVRLGVAVGRALSTVFTALVDDGRQGVGALTELVNEFTRWARTVEGQRAIRQFFQEAFFSIRDLGNFVRTYGPGIGAFFATFGKLTTTLMQILNRLGPAVVVVAGALAGAATFFRILTAAVVPIISPLRYVVGFLGFLASVLGAAAASTAFLLGPLIALGYAITHLGAIVEAVTGAIGAAWRAAKDVLSQVWASLRALAESYWNAIRTAVTTAARVMTSVATGVWRAARDTISSIWGALRSAASSIWAAIRGLVGDASRAARDAAVSAFRAAKDALVAVWGNLKDAARDAWGKLKEIVGDAVSAALARVKGLAGDFFNAGKELVQGLVNGLVSMLGAVKSKVSEILSALNPLNHLPSIPGIGSGPLGAAKKHYGLPDAVAGLGASLAAGMRGELAVAAAGPSVRAPGVAATPLQPVTHVREGDVHNHFEALLLDHRQLDRAASMINDGNSRKGHPSPYKVRGRL